MRNHRVTRGNGLGTLPLGRGAPIRRWQFAGAAPDALAILTARRAARDLR